MKHLFFPDDYQPNIYHYDAEYLKSRGKKALLCDIDNTLVTYDDPDPTPDLLQWLLSLKEAGIVVGFISNNSAERVDRFNASLQYFAAADAHKPLTRELRHFIVETGCKKEEIAHVGDQIFTDVWMAHAGGVTALLVPPIRDKTTFFFRAKRLLEKPILALYLKKRSQEK